MAKWSGRAKVTIEVDFDDLRAESLDELKEVVDKEVLGLGYYDNHTGKYVSVIELHSSELNNWNQE